MSTVTDLAQYREERSPHTAGTCACMACRHKWVGVVPVGLLAFECPACGLEKGVREGLVLPPAGVASLVCPCGGELFLVLDGGHALCPMCGLTQVIDE